MQIISKIYVLIKADLSKTKHLRFYKNFKKRKQIVI